MSDKKTDAMQELTRRVVEVLGPLSESDALAYADKAYSVCSEISATCGDDFELGFFSAAEVGEHTTLALPLYVKGGPVLYIFVKASPELPFAERCETQARLDLFRDRLRERLEFFAP